MIKYRGMKYAVVRIQGKQYLVKEGEEILVGKLGEKKAEAEVLLAVNEKAEEVKIGTPVVDETKVKMKILGDEKGKKIYVQKYKAKSRYRKKIGFRPKFSRVLVEKIG